ncbi:glycosyltransferase family 2 protein [Nodosilinea sp. LEGE 06152]|uniref:glycosyltransferase family 2 protein n=1 Tax=Nodosilinea sp. LEGE 06152 TaxID=2777966 RepID=UPI001880C0C9|nr:glycosyltransferase family A protein [Nodosilinea sp. LEGE 06152]MBE9155756.1 glycosyltransferase family 2 protein [Nodosilinea sp. LEGE 06152]
MKFSLILATLGRTAEISTFLTSLDAQTYRDFELIVIDQNPDDRLVEVLAPYQDKFELQHLRSAKGLSLARNFGLKQISGELVAFPDDDCAYPSDLLAQVNQFFIDSPQHDGLTGRPAGTAKIWDAKEGLINPLNLWRRGISYTIFLRRAVIDSVGPFDETLGVGAGTPWGSGEESDYLLRAIQDGFALYYNPDLTVIHPVEVSQPVEVPSPAQRDFTKTHAYAMGRGRLLRKHQFPIWFVIYNWLRPGLGLGVALLRGRGEDVRSYWATLQGRFQGWLGWA